MKNFVRLFAWPQDGLALLLASVLLVGCATYPENPQLNLISEGQYRDVVDQNTQNKKVYDGFMNILDVSATMLNSPVLNAQADENARIYQWNPEQYQAQKSKNQSEATQQTEMFMSFFVPERKHDDLQRATTRWKVFLDSNGRRYEAKITRVKALLVELQTFYPQHTRWHTGYKLTFPVPLTQVEQGTAKLTLTGPVTSASLDFPPAQ